LNRKPTDYKSVALPIELLGHLVKKRFYYITSNIKTNII